MAEDHVCACWKCQPARFPLPLTRAGVHHVGLRFGDVGRDWCVRVEGVEVHRVLEAFAGPDGWVYVFTEPPHLCRRCRTGICSSFLRGDVEVSQRDGHHSLPGERDS